MYLKYFGLSEAPFSIAPDPRYLYMSKRHQEALAHLLYGLQGDGGFVLLTGEVGAGKTTVCRCLLEQIPDTCDVAYIFNPRLTVEELLSTLCVEFGIACPPGNTSIKVFVDCLNAYLLEAHAQGRHTVLIIDEAQNLAVDVLEQMRLLTNLETNQRKLLQIVLLGQPELADMLERPELRQLAQRIVARYHLGPLTKAEVAAYLRHRLEVSGDAARAQQLFPAKLVGPVYRLSGGIPRLINVLCDRALLGTYVQGKERVDRSTLMQAAREVFHQPSALQRRRLLWLALGLLLAGVATAVALNLGRDDGVAIRPAPAAKAPPAATAAAAEPKPGALPEALLWPAPEPRAQSQETALAALFKAWGAAPVGCERAATLGLNCRSARGDLKELRQIDRPAVLSMHDSDNAKEKFFATLLKIDARSATFAVGASVTTVAQSALADQWNGNYVLLWRKPAQVQTTFREGERGPAVSWIDAQLALAEGRRPGTDARFDAALLRRIRHFQLAHDLEPDGAIGPKTLVQLASVGDDKAPKLAGQGER